MKEGKAPAQPKVRAAEWSRGRAHWQLDLLGQGEGPATAHLSVGTGKAPLERGQGSWASGQASGTPTGCRPHLHPFPGPCTHLDLGHLGALSSQC